eukprot:19294-Heterococcus_DN1.PRE.2
MVARSLAALYFLLSTVEQQRASLPQTLSTRSISSSSSSDVAAAVVAAAAVMIAAAVVAVISSAELNTAATDRMSHHGVVYPICTPAVADAAVALLRGATSRVYIQW